MGLQFLATIPQLQMEQIEIAFLLVEIRIHTLEKKVRTREFSQKLLIILFMYENLFSSQRFITRSSVTRSLFHNTRFLALAPLIINV